MSYLILLSRKKLLPWTQGSVNTDSFMVCQGWQIGTVDVQPLVPKYVDMPTSLCTTVGRLVDSAFFWLFSWLVFFFKNFISPLILLYLYSETSAHLRGCSQPCGCWEARCQEAARALSSRAARLHAWFEKAPRRGAYVWAQPVLQSPAPSYLSFPRGSWSEVLRNRLHPRNEGKTTKKVQPSSRYF